MDTRTYYCSINYAIPKQKPQDKEKIIDNPVVFLLTLFYMICKVLFFFTSAGAFAVFIYKTILTDGM